ncbi:hypothetical protein HDZ31DRAFT_65669 [Schizophyllum fasciatum]
MFIQQQQALLAGSFELSVNAHDRTSYNSPWLFRPADPPFDILPIDSDSPYRRKRRQVVPPTVARLEKVHMERRARRMTPYDYRRPDEAAMVDHPCDTEGQAIPVSPVHGPHIPCIEMADVSATTLVDDEKPMEGVEDTTLVDPADTYPPSMSDLSQVPQSPLLRGSSSMDRQARKRSRRAGRRRDRDQFSKGRCANCSLPGVHRGEKACTSEFAPLHRRALNAQGETEWVSKLEDRPDACREFNEGMACPDDCPADSHWCSLCSVYEHGAQECPMFFRSLGDGKFKSFWRDICRDGPQRRRAPKKIENHYHVVASNAPSSNLNVGCTYVTTPPEDDF